MKASTKALLAGIAGQIAQRRHRHGNARHQTTPSWRSGLGDRERPARFLAALIGRGPGEHVPHPLPLVLASERTGRELMTRASVRHAESADLLEKWMNLGAIG